MNGHAIPRRLCHIRQVVDCHSGAECQPHFNLLCIVIMLLQSISPFHDFAFVLVVPHHFQGFWAVEHQIKLIQHFCSTPAWGGAYSFQYLPPNSPLQMNLFTSSLIATPGLLLQSLVYFTLKPHFSDSQSIHIWAILSFNNPHIPHIYATDSKICQLIHLSKSLWGAIV